MSTQVIRYKCDYCNKELKTEKGMAYHEDKKCWHRPEHMTCFTCGLLIKTKPYEDIVCEEGHDNWYQDYNGVDREMDRPVRKFECEFYEPRSEHPGEYVKVSTGSGGYRKVYLEESRNE